MKVCKHYSVRGFLIVALVALCPLAHGGDTGTPAAKSVPPTLEGTDLYGSKRLTLEIVKKDHGTLLQKCIDESLRGDEQAYATDRLALSKALIKSFDLAFAQLTIIKYFNLHNVPGRQTYATIDVVEKEDAPRRMAFMPRPSGHYDDPDGLLKAWDDYMKIGWELMQSGEITGVRVNCPAFHCIFGHDHPRLAPFRQIFVAGAAKNKTALTNIFLGDHTDQSRANAAFLLAYIKDGTELVKTLSKRVNDEGELVRNNVIRVFSDIAQFHRDLALPVESILQVLDFPETTDRNKVSAVFFGIASDAAQLSKYKSIIMEKAVPIFLQTLRLQQPNNHDFAYMILRALSGKDYGERDYTAWEGWYKSQPPTRMVPTSQIDGK